MRVADDFFILMEVLANGGEGQDQEARLDELYDLENDAALALLNVTPTTLQGVKSALNMLPITRQKAISGPLISLRKAKTRSVSGATGLTFSTVTLLKLYRRLPEALESPARRLRLDFSFRHLFDTLLLSTAVPTVCFEISPDGCTEKFVKPNY